MIVHDVASDESFRERVHGVGCRWGAAQEPTCGARIGLVRMCTPSLLAVTVLLTIYFHIGHGPRPQLVMRAQVPCVDSDTFLLSTCGNITPVSLVSELLIHSAPLT